MEMKGLIVSLLIICLFGAFLYLFNSHMHLGIGMQVREPAVAGKFYPGDKLELEAMVQNFLNSTEKRNINGKILGLVEPHAGYIYSGKVAAYGYRAVEGSDIDSVIIIGPSHYVGFYGASIYNGTHYKTPLGLIEIDSELRKEIEGYSPVFRYYPKAHEKEHSVEVQLPFLQAIGRYRIVPIVMGDHSKEVAKEVGIAVAKAAKGKNVLIVASSDLSHYHPYKEAVKLDTNTIDAIVSLDPDMLYREYYKGKAELCGLGPVAALMYAMKYLDADSSIVLYKANSGDVTGDRHSVVGYVSIAFYKSSNSK